MTSARPLPADAEKKATSSPAVALAVLALLSCLCSHPAAAQTEDVVWVNAVGVSVAGSTLTKTATTAAWDSGAASLQHLEANGFVEVTATQTNKGRVIGLSRGDDNQDYSDVDFELGLGENGIVYVIEAGVDRGAFGTYSVGDRFRVEVGAGVVRYRKNGALLYTSQVAPKFPLRVDTSLYTTGAVLSDVKIGRGSFVRDVGVTVSAGSLTKTGSSGWNAGAVSGQRIWWGDGFVEFTATETNKRRAAGLSKDDTDQSVGDIDFALVLSANGLVEVQENGTARGVSASYSAGDRFRVEAVGDTVRYYQNGQLLYTSGVTPSYPLLLDTAFDDTGSTLADVVLSDLPWTNASGVSMTGNSLIKTGTAGWNAGAVSTAQVESGDAFVEFTAVETNTGRMLGLGHADTEYGAADIDFAIRLTSSGGVQVYEAGTLIGSFGSYSIGDRFRLEVRQGAVDYRKNGVVFYTSATAPQYPLRVDTSLDTPGATLSEVLFGNLVWKNEAAVSVRGYGLADSAATGWGNSGAASTAELPAGDGFVEFQATETSSSRVLGLSHGDTNQDWTDVDFNIGLSENGLVYVIEGGVTQGSFASYAIGDTLRVAVVGGVVKYYRNGSLLYTSSGTPQYPLLVDTSLYTSGSTLGQVHVSAGFSTGAVATPSFSPSPGTYSASQNVTISCSTPSATIHYTTNGQTPTASDPVSASGSSISVSQSMTLKARAYAADAAPSNVGGGVYELKVPSPTASVGSGSYTSPQTVAISCASGVDAHYSTNGAEATTSDTSIACGGTLSIDQSRTVKIRGWKTGWTPSDVLQLSYQLVVSTPTLTPAPGTYATPQTLSVSTATPGAILRYALDGQLPTEASAPPSAGTIPVERTSTLRVRAFRYGWTASDILTTLYTIARGTLSTPTFTPAAGSYSGAQWVSVGGTSTDALVRYTLDGSEPNEQSTAYSGPIRVDGMLTLKARAYAPDYSASATATAAYVIGGASVATPVFTPASGALSTVTGVRVTSATAGATIHYTTNGLDPDASDPTVVSGDSVLVDKALLLKAKAFSGAVTSGVRQGAYVVTGAVAGGSLHSLALKADGTVVAWGRNYSGQLGDGTTLDRSMASVLLPSGIVAVAAGGDHSLALTSGGVVWSWGANESGQIGNGNTYDQATPVALAGLSNVVAIAAAPSYGVAVKADGSVWFWGFGTLAPTQVSGLTSVVGVAAGSFHVLALRSDGTVWSWGDNTWGQLGSGQSGGGSIPPAAVAGLTGISRIAAGESFSAALKTDGMAEGRVFVWGSNRYGELGIEGLDSTPITTPTLTGVTALAAGARHLLVLKSDGSLWSWGLGNGGQLGDGTARDRLFPIQVNGVREALAVGCGANSSLAVGPDGRVFYWGAGGSNLATPVTGLTTANEAWAVSDDDGDGLRNGLELQFGCNSLLRDTNGDGLGDGVAISLGLSCFKPDMDGDGLGNADEVARGTDPFKADTDGDGTSDLADCHPLDPTLVCPSSNPSDVTPPAITILEPAGAIAIP